VLPASFEYHRPDTVDEVLALLSSFGDDGKLLAGGMSFIPLMKLRFAQPGHLIDINRIPELSGISEADGHLMVGPVTRHAHIAASDVVRGGYPLMATAGPLIADPIVRNMGTMGGSLAHGDPAGDWGSVMLAMGGEVVARSESGQRTIAADDLFVSNFMTSLEPNEMITEIRIPTPPAGSGGTYLKLERKVGDFATVGVAVQISLDDGHIAQAGIGLTSVGPRNLKAREAEAALSGAEPTGEVFAEAASLAAQAAQPMADVRGSIAYKRHVVEVYVRRGLARALEIARGE
jgi:aerobic carbon-monoxide dehydrogenase medium subunit